MTDKDKDADTKSTEKKATRKEGPVQAEKRATVFHTDSGFAVNLVDGDTIAPTERYTDGLSGLVEKVEELKENGFEVVVQDKLVK